MLWVLSHLLPRLGNWCIIQYWGWQQVLSPTNLPQALCTTDPTQGAVLQLQISRVTSSNRWTLQPSSVLTFSRKALHTDPIHKALSFTLENFLHYFQRLMHIVWSRTVFCLLMSPSPPPGQLEAHWSPAVERYRARSRPIRCGWSWTSHTISLCPFPHL